MREATPILYESSETAFVSNGLGRLRDCLSCVVTEERNGIYECDFSYPVDGAHFDLIQCGRIVGVTHDESGNVQPFDIVSYSKPINGVVEFHAVHISYRQSGLVVRGTNINTLADALSLLASAQPSNPFTYSADFTRSAYMAAADGVPRTVRQMLGGIDGSILDTYGGEYEFNRFNVILHQNRGQARDFAIRYGINMLDYQDDTDYSGTYSSCIPYWQGDDNGNQVTVVGSRVDIGGTAYNGRNICAPLDLTDKFETKPTAAQLQSLALTLMQSRQTTLPAQTITVDFVRLQDLGFDWLDNLLQCNLCDTINVVFPRYNMSGRFKIVKTEWDVLSGRYNKMELGALSMSLSEALGITNTLGTSSGGGGSVSVDTIYPVGSIYMSVNNVNPSTYFDNTTWVQIKDRFLLAAGDTYAGGATGGEATHKLTAAESGVPAHGHGFTQPSVSGGSHYHALSGSKTAGLGTGDYLRVGYGSATGKNTATDGSHSHTVSGGAVQQSTAANAANAHNNMPPYIAVYMWKRTA